eukprot:snap_masked-scaffold_35-processed-gene-2.5-mRNA-1 protein AED:1.00 eAED:1.00 QI:0/-1/0/0/-1/1/1/0/71
MKNLFFDIQGGTTKSCGICGWEDIKTGRKYTLFTVDNGIWFIDTTEPVCAIQVAYGPNAATKDGWTDVKIY